MNIQYKAALGVVVLLVGTVCSGLSNASSVGYYLNQSNVGGLPDGTNYLQVTMDNNTPSSTGNDALISFTVEVLTYDDGGILVPTSNFGIQAFAFNLTDGVSLQEGDIINLPSLWSVSTIAGTDDLAPKNADGFGKHDVFLSDGGQDRRDPLTFAIDVNGDSFSDYFAPSGGGVRGPSWFSAHVAGIKTGAWFGSQDGSDGPPNEIPVPAAVWLFGSGLIGLAGIGRRKKIK